jgi:psp operon transcriptional activator
MNWTGKEVPHLTSGAVKTLESYPWPGNVRELKNVIERAVYKSPSHRIGDISFDPFQSRYGEGLGTGPTRPVLIRPDHPRSGAMAPNPGSDVSSSAEGAGQRDIMAALFEKPLKESIRALEFHRLCAALSTCRYNQKKAAALLGISYDQFRGLKKKYGPDL